ncbi:MAG: response regulator transcription factor [Actinobacteria bacterium]|nr:response regulator transcription factor [Actinomycetota bacterium]
MTLTVLVLSDRVGEVTQLLPAWPMGGGYRVAAASLKDIAVKDLIETHPDMVLVDGTGDLGLAEEAARLLSLAWEIGLPPVIVVLDEQSLQRFRLESGADDFLMVEASSDEISTRLSMALQRSGRGDEPVVLKVGDLTVNPDNYQTYLRGRPLDLTYKEFELLKFLAQRPGRVCNRDLLLQEVWGYDYYGGTRTVDVHVRRLRAKLGPEHEALIETIRNVGYRLVPRPRDR